MGMQKPHWFPFYGRDFFGDEKVKLFTLRQVGIYLALLWHQWEEGSIPGVKICQMLPVLTKETRDRKVFTEIFLVHSKCFTRHPTLPRRYFNEKLERVKREQDEKYQAIQARASKGGHAKRAASSSAQAVLKQEVSSAQAVLNPADSDSDSDSSSFKKKKKVSRAQRLEELEALSISEDLRAWAMKELRIVIPDDVLREFKDYWRGQRTLRTEWEATLKNRLRELVGRRVLVAGPSGSVPMRALTIARETAPGEPCPPEVRDKLFRLGVKVGT